jgi:hypothetical protein
MLSQCIEWLKKEDCQKELRQIMIPLTDTFIIWLKPYVIFVCVWMSITTILLLYISYSVFKKI